MAKIQTFRDLQIGLTRFLYFGVLLAALGLCSCTQRKELGTEKNPIKLHFVPSVDAKVIEDNSKILKDYLEKHTPYKYEITIPQSFVAVVEAFGTERADVAALNTYGYYKAYEKFGVEARLTVIRNGLATYQSQFIAKANGKIKKIEDLQGKRVAFVDASSGSGYLVPLKTLKDKNIKPSEIVFAGKHDNVIAMVYQGQVDAGATFYSPPSKNEKGEEVVEDARYLVLTQYPDVMQKTVIIGLSDQIPNDAIAFRKNMPEEMKQQIVEALLEFIKTDAGKASFKAVYGGTELQKATDADYEQVRKMFKVLGDEVAEQLKKGS